MKFSICIPNYNYQNYLGQTLESVLRSNYSDIEIIVSDNNSADDSIKVIKEYQSKYSNISLFVNPTNIGFAANLDCAGSKSSGERVIMLSSDDLMNSKAASVYESVVKQHPRAIVSSSWDIIDSSGKIIGYNGPNKRLWRKEDKDHQLSNELHCNVYKINTSTLLKRCLQNMATPFNFCTVCYAKEWYNQVGGYGGGRVINPDKWFHWKLLTVAEDAIFIDKALFQYRWHDKNQSAQQAQSGYLKYLFDEYRNVMEVTEPMLVKSRLTKGDIEYSFIKRDIYHHGIGEFSKGRWLKSLRIFFFGLSSFPKRMIVNGYFVPYFLILLTTPIGSKLVSVFLRTK